MKPDILSSQLFEPEPIQWSLRGDPHLWRSMNIYFASHLLPSSEQELRAQFEQAFEGLTGKALDTTEPFFVESFSHGGMSSGMIDPDYWQETVWPLLVKRFRQMQN